MLIVWTSTDSRGINSIIAPAIKALRPNIPKHKFVAFKENAPPPVPEAGDVVLALGNRCLKALQGAGLAKKGRTLGSLRETALPAGEARGHYFLSYDPGVCSSEPDKADIIAWDMQLIARFMRTGSLTPEVGDYEWVSDFGNTIDYIKEQYAETGAPVKVSLDTETMGLDPFDSSKDIVSIQVTCMLRQGQAIYLGPNFEPKPLADGELIWEQLNWLLNSEMVSLQGANLKYDLVWIALKYGIECSNFKFDTTIVGSMLNENRSNGLNMHAKLFTPFGGYDDELNDKYDKAHMEDVPPDDLLPYACGDTDAVQHVAEVFRDQLLEDPYMANVYANIVHPAARAFEKIERRGVVIDREKMAALRADLSKDIEQAQKTALGLLPIAIKEKFADKIDAQMDAGKSPFTPAIKREFFFSPLGLNLKPKMLTPKSGEPVLTLAHLKMFKHKKAQGMLQCLAAEGSASKMRSTFVDGFVNCIREDGRIHPSYMLFHGGFNDSTSEADEAGTNTGRLSARSPAFQTIPKKKKKLASQNWAKRIRACYPAPEGQVMLELDFSQGELRVVACVAGEENMLNAYKQGLDLHAVTGAKLGGYELDAFLAMHHGTPEEQAIYDDLRGKAKPANFGLLYGMGAAGFMAYCWAQYDLALTLTEAEEMRNSFFELYPGLIDYHAMQRAEVRANGFVRSPLGRIRHLPHINSWDQSIRALADRQAINSPIQSCLSDMMLLAIGMIDREFDGIVDIVGTVHDSLIAYIPEVHAQELVPKIRHLMSNLPLADFGWEPQITFPADAKTGPNMADLEDFKLAA